MAADKSHPTALLIAGPTASGKSAVALELAERFGGTVINADSMQVYRELSLLTARPEPAEMAAVPHRLYGTVPAAESYSVGRWLADVAAAIEAAQGEGRVPIVVGGTGLYLRALTDGLAPVPGIPQGVRSEARRLHARIGGEAFRAELAKVDAEAAGRLEAGDSQRLIRALEVVRATGRPLADWQRQGAGGPATDARFATIVLAPPRDALYAAIDARLDTMIEEGALDEVAALDRLGLDRDLPAAKAVGVPELRRHLRGEITLDEALHSAKRASRNFAKRQLTWLRHQMLGAHVVPAQYSESLRPEIFSFICRFLLTGRP